MGRIETNFKQTEVGLIPVDWELKKLSEITTLMTNGFVGNVKSQYTDSNDGVTYIQGYNVEENSFNYNGIKKVTTEFHKIHLKSCLQEQDLLTIQTGDVGLTTIVPKELVGANCHALIISRFKKEKSNPKYFSLYLNSSFGRARLKEIETGTTMKHINVGDMIHFFVPVPDKTEQTLIANALSDADGYIESLEKLIDKKQKIKQGAMQQLLKPKENWEVKPLGNVIHLQGGYAFKSDLFIDVGVPIIRISNIDSDVVSLENSVYYEKFNIQKEFIVKKGDALIAMSGATTGKIGVYNDEKEAYINQRVGKFVVLDDKQYSYEFVSHIIHSKKFSEELFKQISQGAQPNISGKQIESIELSFPKTKTEQEKIAQTLSDIDTEITALTQKLTKAKAIKQGMMQQLLTGKIRLI